MSEAAIPAAQPARPVWALIGVEALSFLGSEIARFGISVWIYQATQSVYAFALLILANTVPGMLAAPFAGSIVDRHPRKQVMIGAATVSLCGTLIVLSGAASSHLSIWIVACGAALASIGESFQWPALSASLPLMASEEDLPRFNGFLETGRATSMLAGPIIGGVLIGFLNLPGLLAIEVITFITAVSVVSLLHIPRPGSPGSEDAPPEEEHSLWADSSFGLKFIWQHKPLLKFLCVSVYANFFLSIGIVLMPPYGLSLLSERSYGIAYGLFGGGMIAGGLAYTVLCKRIKNVWLFLGTAILMGAIYSGYGLARGLVSLSALNFLLAALMTIGNTAIVTIWQVKVPEESAGRVLSTMNMVAGSAGPISYLLAGPLSENFVPWLLSRPFARPLTAIFGSGKPAEMGFLFSAMGLLLLAGFALALLVKDVRGVEEHPV